MTEQITTVEIDNRRECPGSHLALPSDLVHKGTNGDSGYCPDCGQEVPVWLSGSWFRAAHRVPEIG